MAFSVISISLLIALDSYGYSQWIDLQGSVISGVTIIRIAGFNDVADSADIGDARNSIAPGLSAVSRILEGCAFCYAYARNTAVMRLAVIITFIINTGYGHGSLCDSEGSGFVSNSIVCDLFRTGRRHGV